ncbi:cytochrome P450 [Rhodococcus gannanensis]|uniref:Cytochrome P450 n=1 Tax=Rhodococcus gannanensis TaxID=1960308 RepID=A0ABW4PA63_9NOCA
MNVNEVPALDLFDPDVLDDPYPLYAWLREHAPVCRVPGTDRYLVSTAELVAEACARTDDFSSHLTAALVQGTDGPAAFDMTGGGQAVQVLATADDPDHAAHRRLVLPTLVAKRIRALEPQVGALAERLWEDGLDGRRIDWAAAVADRLPMAMVARLIGLPDGDVPQLLAWSYDSTEMLGGVVTESELSALSVSAALLAGHLYAAFERAQRDPRDDLLGDLARACAGGAVGVTEAVLILVQLVGAGGESTASLIGSAARVLAERRDLQSLLRADPTMVAPFIDEMLRFESPFRGHHRHVTRQTSLGGVPLGAGSHLTLLWGAANRDPAVFEAPDEVRLHRPNLKANVAFGRGAHFCVGAALARMEAQVALRLLLERTESVGLVDAEWAPSLLVRRHSRLTLSTRG